LAPLASVTTATALSAGVSTSNANDAGAPEKAQRHLRRGARERAQQGVEPLVGLDLLLDAGELRELSHELGAVQRLQRVLVLQLRGHQPKEHVVVLRDLVLVDRGRQRGSRPGGGR
jgi:hypothetical protein